MVELGLERAMSSPMPSSMPASQSTHNFCLYPSLIVASLLLEELMLEKGVALGGGDTPLLLQSYKKQERLV